MREDLLEAMRDEAMKVVLEKRKVKNALTKEPDFCYGERGFRQANPSQKKLHECNSYATLMVGGVRAGKSFGVANELRKHAKVAGNRIIVVKHTMVEVERSIKKTLFGDAGLQEGVFPTRWIKADHSRSQREPRYELINGTTIYLGGLNDRGKWGGTDYAVALIDDVFNPKRLGGQITKLDFEYLDGRLSFNGVPERRIYLTSNPPPNRRHWLYDVFPEYETKDRYLIHCPTEDNRENLPHGWIEERKRQYGEAWVKRFLQGLPVEEAEGPAAYKNFDSLPGGRHIIEDLAPIPGEPLWISWDFGWTPCITVHQFTPNKRPMWRILYEDMGDEISLDEWAPVAMAKVREAFGHRKFEERHCCDHTGNFLNYASQKDQKTYVQVLNDFGIVPISTPMTAEYEGIMIIQKYLDKHNGIGVATHCPMVIEGFSGGLQMETDSSGIVRTNKTRRDGWLEHPMDTLRFFACNVVAIGEQNSMSIPQAPGPPPYWDQGMQVKPERSWEPDYNVPPPPRDVDVWRP